MKHGPALAVLAALTLLICTVPCSAGTVYVKWDSPGPTFDGTSWDTAFHTVQEGLNASVSGDEVWVARGTYVERITMKAGVVLYGGYSGSGTARDMGIYLTALEGTGGFPVILCGAGITTTTVIDGFTIRYADTTTVTNAYGISCNSGSPTITNNTIVGMPGYGIYVASSAVPVIANNMILGNAGNGIGGGAGASPTITNNIIAGNGNNGIVCSGTSTVTNNTITGNNSSGVSCSSASATVSNNIVAFNCKGITSLGGIPTLSNNCVYGNTSYNYSGLSAGVGDVSVDPLLADKAYANAHLQLSSPCINAGSNGAPGLPSTDMDGQSRVQDGTADIGAERV